jgi:hypothetical protein
MSAQTFGSEAPAARSSIGPGTIFYGARHFRQHKIFNVLATEVFEFHWQHSL